ncbi:thermonuclease family protein [Candidatus Gracilibacteria bacterium]|nr:thermonuclease family protein [Candidatus Gracilibacteria bacterium]
MKKYLIFFVITLSLHIDTFAITNDKHKWREVKVDRIINNEYLLLFDGRKIKIWGIDAPDIFDNRKTDQCFSRPTFRLLKLLLENKNIKIWEKKNLSFYGILPKHIKFENGQYLTEFMLKNGMGRFKNPKIEEKFVSKYKKAEIIAQKEKKGIWGFCGIQNSKKYSISRSFQKKYAPFLANISVGKVKKVFSGKSFQLENNLKVSLIGIDTPLPTDNRNGFACFGEASKNHLETLILKKKIHLIRDRSQLDENRKLLRYVFLSPKADTPKTFINKEMIIQGFAKNSWSTKDNHYKKEFTALQKKVYKNPNGAWINCTKEILNQQRNSNKKTLKFDENCRIKGNISGSKKNPVKTYHTPASHWYKNLKEEKCFDNEDAAQFDGFRKIK